MKKICCLLLPLLLLLCACRSNTPVPAGVRISSCTEEETGQAVFSISYYTLPGENDFPQTFSKAFSFEGLQQVEYDTYSAPFRFDKEFSLWATYDKTPESFDNWMGRCISSEEDTEFIRKALIDREYKEDPQADAAFFTPMFELRKGEEAVRCNERVAAGIEIVTDEPVYRYRIRPDGYVLRSLSFPDAEMSAEPLSTEEVARLYLIHETYFLTRDVVYPDIHAFENTGNYHLCIEQNGKRMILPNDHWDDFVSLVTDREEPLYPEEPSCCAITNLIYAENEYSSPEVLRFLIYPASEDPDRYSESAWYSLREDGKLIRRFTSSVGALSPQSDRWVVHSPVLQISKTSFDVSAILALVDSCR